MYLLVNGHIHTGGGTTPFGLHDTPDVKTASSSMTHNLLSRPADSLLVISTNSPQGGAVHASVSSSPTLTWTKVPDVQSGSGGCEIYQAVFAAGGNIDITVNWGSFLQSSAAYTIVSFDAAIDGASATAGSQDSANVNINTTKSGSLIICNTIDWNGSTGTRTYRGTAIEVAYQPGAATSFHYYYEATDIAAYTVGFTAPSEIGSMNTAVLEIKAGVGSTPDTTPPSAPVLSTSSIGSTSIGLSWTAATDDVGVNEYEIYKDAVLQDSVDGSTLTYNLTGLTASTMYSIYVRAKDAADNGTDSNTITPTTDAPGSGDFTFTQIAYSEPDLINPGRGAEQWHNSTARISNPDLTNPQGTENSYDVYYRKQWTWFEKVTEGNYDFADFDGLVEDAINNGQRLSFGIMPVYTGSDIGENEAYGGFGSSYPLYLHTLMQAAVDPDDRDVVINNWWVPNWNHASYLARLRALHAALNTHILASSHVAVGGPNNGVSVSYSDAIYCIDIRGYGQWGEWHTFDITDFTTYPGTGYPGNQLPTIATYKEIIDLHTEEFDNWPLVMMVAGFNGSGNPNPIDIFHQEDEIGHYALTATNTWGKVGYRRDQVGATDEYLHGLLEDNATTYLGSAAFSSLFLNLYKTAPGTGEPYPGQVGADGMIETEAQCALYHATSFGNGNYPTPPANDSTAADNIRAGFKKCGYRYKITTGTAPTTIQKGIAFNISTFWINVGVAPTYDAWDVVFELHDVSDNIIWSDTSTKVLKLFTPDAGEVETVDTFTVPSGVTNGTYSLCVRVKPSSGVISRPNMELAIQGINAGNSYHDKFYVIHDSVTVTTGV